MEQRSTNNCRMTINERKFIEKALLSELRFDGRRPFDYRQLTIKFGSEEGSSEVQLGQTHVMPFVTSQLVQPYRDRPNEGTRSIFTEFSPIADSSFEPGHPGEYAVELGCMVDCGLRESGAADTESLCVLAGRLVWAIRVDLHILDNGGNLVDAANIAALAALMTFRRPECTPEGDNGQEVIVHPPEVKEPLPLIIHHLHVAVTFAFFGSGDILVCKWSPEAEVIDPTHYEEAVMRGWLTATINASGDVCVVQKAGGEGVMQSVIMQCMRVASLKAADITSQIKNAGSILKGPHGAKSITNSRDCSFDPNEPHWRTNSSFLPPLSRRWDCRFQSDGVSIGDPIYGSSLSSNSKGSRSRVSSDQYPNHHHSVSDGELSYFGSPAESFQAPRWTPPVQKFNFELATPSAGGSRPESSLLPHFSETHFTARAYAVSYSFGSPSPLSESWESSSKQPPSFLHRNFSSRRSFMSKPVYPLVYQNPVSDSEACGSVDETNCIMLAPNNRRSPMWSESPSSLDLKFHNTLTELQKMEASPDPSMSSRREGFRWSNASSNDMGFDGQSIDMTERLYLENVRLPYNPTDDQKCGLCGRLLVQKSPWSSYRIVRSGDMPIAGVLPCSHVFHAECLEQKTPKTQVHDPPCHVCQKIANGAEASSPVLEPLQMALRAVRMNQGVDIEANGEGNDDQLLYQMESRMTRNRSLSIPRQGGNASIKNHFKKHFSFKGKMGKDLFGAKLFLRAGSSSSNPHDNQNPVGCL